MDFQAKEEKLIFAFVILFITLSFIACCFSCCIHLAIQNQQSNHFYQQLPVRNTEVNKKGEIELKPIIKSKCACAKISPIIKNKSACAKISPTIKSKSSCAKISDTCNCPGSSRNLKEVRISSPE